MKKQTPPDIERNLFLPALAGFFVAGVWLATKCSAGLWPLWILPIAALLVVPLRALKLPLRLVWLPVALMLALLWTQYWLNPQMPAEGNYDGITATVYGDSKINNSGNATFTLTDVTLDGEPQRGKAYAYIYTSDGDEPVQLSDGQRIRFSGKVYHPYPKENEYDFDFPMWMRQNRLNYGISSVKDIEFLFEKTHWADYAQRIAAACHEKLQTVMGEQADLAVAMLLGDSGALAEDDYAAFKRAGVAHIMAVSGLHVGILSMALIWLLNRLRLRKIWQIPVVAVFLLLYCGVTGFAVSSLRAAVMVLLWVIAGAFGRKPNPITVVSAAALIVLIINPLQLFSAGFVLSFSAIAGIVLLYPRFMQGLERVWPPVKVEKRRWLRYRVQRLIQRFKQVLAVTVSAQLGVLLPVAAYFHVLYPYGLSFNMLIVPIVGYLVPLYAVTALVVWIPWIGGLLSSAL
ncbi:MAG: ComEC/Rec2 family competence protein, partial [Clostridiales bacterium]|nr:ComEC/Rec2 family competence protein [Clostridiales bacterium]